MSNATIDSIGVEHGEFEVSTEDLVRDSGLLSIGGSADCISRKLGITHVRFSSSDKYPSDLAASASKTALERAGLSARDIDAVFYCGIDRDAREPSTACFVSDKLGMDDTHLQLAVDITNACHGFTAAIEACEAAIILGKWKHVLICTGEKPSIHYKDLAQDIHAGVYSPHHLSELEGLFSCSDVGAAMVLSRSNNESGIVYFKTCTRPAHADACQIGDMKDKYKKVMQMKRICDETLDLVKTMEPLQVYDQLGWSPDDVSYFVQHQVGKLPYLVNARQFKVKKGQSPAIFERYGNLTSASIPAVLDSCRLTGGEKVIIQSTGSGIVVSQWALIWQNTLH